MLINNHLQAERSILSTIMMYNENYDLISGMIDVNDFESVMHQKVYQAIINLVESNQPFDTITIHELISTDGQDTAYIDKKLAEIDGTPTAMPKSLIAHVELVRAKSLRRKSQFIIRQAMDRLGGHDDTDDINNDIVNAITNLEQKEEVQEVFSVDDLINNQIERITAARSGDQTYIDIGFPELSNLMRVKAGNLVVVAARPGQGKSLVTVNMQTHLAKFRDGVSVFFSVEMDEADVWDRLTAAETGIPINTITDFKMNEDQMAKHQRFISDAKDLRFRIVRKTGITVSQVRMHLNKLKRQHGKIGSVAVDYLGIMGGIDGDDAVKKIGIVARTLKELGSEFDCPIFLLSQLNRSVEKRPNKKPVLSDLRDSGNIEEVADIVLMLYREDYYKEKDGSDDLDGMADMLITKNRSGKTGTVRLAFEGHMGRFSNYMPYHDSFDNIPNYGSNQA